MVKFMKGALLVGAASLALGSVASAALPNKAELKCMTSVSKAGAKFTGAKAKCAIKCQGNAAKLVNPIAECYAPYAGTTLTCITEPVLRKGAEEKYEDAIRKACDPSFSASATCPACGDYAGDCTTFASDRVDTNETQIDGFGGAVFCLGNFPGSNNTNAPTKEELGCESNTAKVLSKLVGSINKCYDKCNANILKGTITDADQCAPPASDGPTATCLSAAKGKAILGIDKKCGDVGAIAVPDCNNDSTDDYFDGATWVNVVSSVIEGNVPTTYCSPSGAFLD
jgi:hypothetical protein